MAIITRGRYAGKKVRLTWTLVLRAPQNDSVLAAVASSGTTPKARIDSLLRLGCHHPASRHRLEVTPVPSRLGSRHRALSIPNHPSHVKRSPGQAQQGQAIHQDHQLQPPDADTVHFGIGGIEGCGNERHIQGGVAEGGGEEDGEEGVGGAVHEREEPVVFHSIE